ncbi:hypothetical protein Avbf_11015 [Armadillidium vulgare]|nr:hypothetical protein Avbf_11015 [Armadillidium vulgare]
MYPHIKHSTTLLWSSSSSFLSKQVLDNTKPHIGQGVGLPLFLARASFLSFRAFSSSAVSALRNVICDSVFIFSKMLIQVTFYKRKAI